MDNIIVDPDLEERKLDSYYFCKAGCSNCGKPNGMYDGTVDVMIKKGIDRKEIKSPVECPYCGCCTLELN